MRSSCPLYVCVPPAQRLSQLTEFYETWYEVVILKVRRMPHFKFPGIINGNMAKMRTFQARTTLALFASGHWNDVRYIPWENVQLC
jgi:hypothetical protein